MPKENWPEVTGYRKASFMLEGRLAKMSRRVFPLELAFREDQSLRRLAELLGIPAAEIGLALADGESWPLELPPPEGSSIRLLPMAEPVSLHGRPSFLTDSHLGRLARELRLLGFDAIWRGALGRDEMIETALGEERVLLTRDRSLLFRRELAREGAASDGRRCMLLLSKDPYGQLLETCARYGLAGRWRPLSLCSACGGLLRRAEKAEVIGLVPPIVAERYVEFQFCPSCGKVYWKGDHARNIEALLARLNADIGGKLGAAIQGPLQGPAKDSCP
jgi:uncharacterized protein